MLTQTRRDDDADNAFDDRGVLKDGRTLRVPMKMMDAADLPKVRDADGGALAQPGFTRRDDVTDATALMRQVLYDTYDKEVSERWKNPPAGIASHGLVGARAGDLCTVRSGGGRFGREGADGHLRAIDDELVCVADGFELNSNTDHSTADPNTIKDATYATYDQELGQAWRRAR